MGKRRCVAEFWWGHLRARNHVEDLYVDGTIILKWIFKEWDVGLELD